MLVVRRNVLERVALALMVTALIVLAGAERSECPFSTQ
jgi:hypothetical protein